MKKYRNNSVALRYFAIYQKICDKYRKNSNFCDKIVKTRYRFSCSDVLWRFEHGVVRSSHTLLAHTCFRWDNTLWRSHKRVHVMLPATHATKQTKHSKTKQQKQTSSSDVVWACRGWCERYTMASRWMWRAGRAKCTWNIVARTHHDVRK